jgi:hypothetical protein
LLAVGDEAASVPDYCRLSVDEIYPRFAGAIALPGAEPRLRRRDTPIIYNAEEEAKSALLSEDTPLETALLDRTDRILRAANDYMGLPMVLDPERRGLLHVVVPSEAKNILRDLAGRSDLKFYVSEECYLFSTVRSDLVNTGLVGRMNLVSEKGIWPTPQACLDRLLVAALGVFGNLEPLAQVGSEKEGELPAGAGFVLEVLYNDRLWTNHRLEEIPVREVIKDVLRRRCGS